jgi:hypothetical protein
MTSPLFVWLHVAANDLDRDGDVLIIEGAYLPALIGTPPADIIAFSYTGSWVQVPVQIDERAIVDFGTVYNEEPTGYTFLAYTDTSTFTGPDPAGTFDSNDELVLRADDAGMQVISASYPDHTITGTGIELEITNPLNAGTSYLYLFVSDGSLDPAAGVPDINYQFILLSGDYKTTYQLMGGGNPENSSVVTSAYAVHFSDRWIRDETAVTEGGASGADILDRHKNLFAPGNCGRSENTFSAGEGAFIINKAGPIRVIRGYVGANSGPTTYRINFFYEVREVIHTVLRVHSISGMMDYFDYDSVATGMTYYNSLNTGGLTIDGLPDAVTSGPPAWEMVTGAQGTLAITPVFVTDIPDFNPTNYYSDDFSPTVTQCTGDDHEYGASGIWIDHAIPNTDPGATGDLYHFEAFRYITYGPPDMGIEFAMKAANEPADPLIAHSSPFNPAAAAETGPASRIGDIALFSVFPNPAGGAVQIRFSLYRQGLVSIVLYDAAGRRVRTLAKGSWEAGEHSITRSISGLSAGVYFARAIGPSKTQYTTRVIILN